MTREKRDASFPGMTRKKRDASFPGMTRKRCLVPRHDKEGSA